MIQSYFENIPSGIIEQLLAAKKSIKVISSHTSQIIVC